MSVCYGLTRPEESMGIKTARGEYPGHEIYLNLRGVRRFAVHWRR